MARAAAAEQRRQGQAAVPEQHREQAAARAAAAEQRRQQAAAHREQEAAARAAAREAVRQHNAVPLYKIGRQPFGSYSEHLFNRSHMFVDSQTGRLSIGLMRHICVYCGARHFLGEKSSHTPQCRPGFANCCYNGKVKLDPIGPYPDSWADLLTRTDEVGRHFRQYARRYNQTLSMASTGVLLITCLPEIVLP